MSEDRARSSGPLTLPSRRSEKLHEPATCIAFSRVHPKYFLVGTYVLHVEQQQPKSRGDDDDDDDDAVSTVDETTTAKPIQRRTGSVMLWADEGDELRLAQRCSCMSAVLDLSFNPHQPHEVAAAGSDGYLTIFLVRLDTRETASVAPEIVASLFPASTMLLSVAWHPTFADVLGITLSTGGVAIVKIQRGIRPHIDILRSDLHNHGFSCWTLAFPSAREATHSSPARSYDHAVHSGGDDQNLRVTWFAGEDGPRYENVVETQVVDGLHRSGVTALLPFPADVSAADRDLLLTGSYDEHVRIVDPIAKVVRARAHLGGGVWRLKLMQADCGSVENTGSPDSDRDPVRDHHAKSTTPSASAVRLLVLASCIEAGARVLEITKAAAAAGGNWTIQVRAVFAEHQDANYGSDVQLYSSPHDCPRPPQGPPGDPPVALYSCASISYVDKLLCVWDFPDVISRSAAPGSTTSGRSPSEVEKREEEE